MGFLLCALILIHIRPHAAQWCMQYHVIFYRIITAPTPDYVHIYEDITHLRRFILQFNITNIGYALCRFNLTHWGRVTHICVSKLTIIGSDNGLSPKRRQANIWTNAGILLIGTLGTIFSEILIEILAFSFKKMRLKVSSAKWRPFVSTSMC